MTNIQKIIAFIISLTTLVSIAFAYDARKANKCDLDTLSQRVEQKILEDRVHNLQQRIWALEDRYGGVGVPLAPEEVRKEYRELKHELEIAKGTYNK